MKTRSMLIGVAMAAVFNCAAVNAQVLGGLGGGLGGGLSGGLRDMNMVTHGSLNGSLGADLDASSLHRTTRDTTDRVTHRARNTTSSARDGATTTLDQTREKVGETRKVATAATSAAATAAVDGVKDTKIEGAADIAGSATSNVSRDGINLASAAQGAGNGAVKGGEPQPGLSQSELPTVVPTKLPSGGAPIVSNPTQPVTEPTKAAAPAVQPSNEGSASGLLGAAGSANTGESSKASHGLLNTPNAKTAEKSSQPARGLNIASNANGSASASRSGVSAEGSGTMSASRK